MATEYIDWPEQNDADIAQKIEKLLREAAIRPQSERIINVDSACDSLAQCNKNKRSTFQRTVPQEVLQTIVTPKSRYNILARHDVGTGKTCGALGVAKNFSRAGKVVFWVSRRGLARSAIMKSAACFSWSKPSTGAKREAEKLGLDDAANLWGNKKLPIQVLSYINLFNLMSPNRSNTDKERLQRLGIDPDTKDPFQDTLLIIDEPHTIYTAGSLGAEGRKDLWPRLQEAVFNSYKNSGDKSVTVLLLTATPLTNELDNAAKLINMLIRDEKRRLPVGAELVKWLETEPQRLLDLMRGYISYYDGSNDPTRFAQPIKQRHFVKDVKEEYHGQLQVSCAKGSLEPPSDKDARKKMAACYFERGDFVGIQHLPEKWKDFNLVQKGETSSEQKQRTRDAFLKEADIMAPKTAELYAQIKKLDEEDLKAKRPLKKHLIFSGSNKMTTSVGAVAAYFAAKGHGKVNVNYGETVTFENSTPFGEEAKRRPGNYILITKSAALQSPKVASSKVKRFQKDVFAYLNARPENVFGERARFIILDYSFKEGVDAFDIGYLHLLEKQKTPAETEQAMGRALRMCGNCQLPKTRGKLGWKLPTFIYDIEADRLPLIDEDYEMDGEAPKGNREARQEMIAEYKSECVPTDRRRTQSELDDNVPPCPSYGDAVRNVFTDKKELELRNTFTQLMQDAAIDKGFYQILETLEELQRRYKQVTAPKFVYNFWTLFAQDQLSGKLEGKEKYTHLKFNPALRRIPGSTAYVMVYRCFVPKTKFIKARLRHDENWLQMDNFFNGIGVAILSNEFVVMQDRVLSAGADIANVRLYPQKLNEFLITYTNAKGSRKQMFTSILTVNPITAEYTVGSQQMMCANVQFQQKKDVTNWILNPLKDLILSDIAPLEALAYPACKPYLRRSSTEKSTSVLRDLENFYENFLTITNATNWLPFTSTIGRRRQSKQTTTYLLVAEAEFNYEKVISRAKTVADKRNPLYVLLHALRKKYLTVRKNFSPSTIKFLCFVLISTDPTTNTINIEKYSDFFVPQTHTLPTLSVSPRSLDSASKDEERIIVAYGSDDLTCSAFSFTRAYIDSLLHPCTRAPESVGFFEMKIPLSTSPLPDADKKVKRVALIMGPASRNYDLIEKKKLTPWLADADNLWQTEAVRKTFISLSLDLKYYAQSKPEYNTAITLVPIERATAAKLSGFDLVLTNWAPPKHVARTFKKKVPKTELAAMYNGAARTPSALQWNLFTDPCLYFPCFAERGVKVSDPAKCSDKRRPNEILRTFTVSLEEQGRKLRIMLGTSNNTVYKAAKSQINRLASQILEIIETESEQKLWTTGLDFVVEDGQWALFRVHLTIDLRNIVFLRKDVEKVLMHALQQQ